MGKWVYNGRIMARYEVGNVLEIRGGNHYVILQHEDKDEMYYIWLIHEVRPESGVRFGWWVHINLMDGKIWKKIADTCDLPEVKMALLKQ